MDEVHCRRWRESGLQRATTPLGREPVAPPPGLITRVDHLVERLTAASTRWGRRVERDGLSLLAERWDGVTQRSSGTISLTGNTRLVPCRDGWIAVTISRPDDVGLVPALVAADAVDEPWTAVTEWCTHVTAREAVDRGVMLGLALAALDEPQDAQRDADGSIVTSTSANPTPIRSLEGIKVIDLSSLWAGPLCGALLAAAGADVTKVESLERPDGLRDGDPLLFERLNGAKRSRQVSLSSAAGRDVLKALLADADVVIEASRPRAMQQLGITVPSEAARVWLSITAHGYGDEAGLRIGYGDDAAVAGGLIIRDADGPAFLGDAIADPLSGLTAATVALELLAEGGRHHVDLAMSAVASRCTTAA